jgi:hypothetical protein
LRFGHGQWAFAWWWEAREILGREVVRDSSRMQQPFLSSVFSPVFCGLDLFWVFWFAS